MEENENMANDESDEEIEKWTSRLQEIADEEEEQRALGIEPLYGATEYQTFLSDTLELPSDYIDESSLITEENSNLTINENENEISPQSTNEDSPIMKLAEEIQNELITKLQFQKESLYFGPNSETRNLAQNSSFMLMSPNALTNSNNLLVIVQNSGKNLRPGLWSTSTSGSMFPFLEKAIQKGFGILLLNPNDNTRMEKISGILEPVPLKGSESAAKHLLSVWDKYISNCQAKKITFFGTGYGSSTILSLLNQRSSDFLKRVSACAFVNSKHRLAGHGFLLNSKKEEINQFISKKCVNWKHSSQAINSALTSLEGCTCRSGGSSASPEDIIMQSVDFILSFLQES